MYNLVSTLAPSFSIFAGKEDNHTISGAFGPIRPRTAELAAIERLKKNPIDF